MRLGIFGGSFDPVHNGHLALARSCQRAAALDEVWITPAAVQPLKHHGPVATDAQRLAMLELAIISEPTWRICRLELDRGGLSYTVDTLRTIRAQRPGDELYFLLGGDTLRDVPQWKEPAEIFRLASPLVVHRAGEPPPDLALVAPYCGATGRPQLVDMPVVDVSSTDVRRRAATGEPIDHLVPSAVANYITRYDLYR